MNLLIKQALFGTAALFFCATSSSQEQTAQPDAPQAEAQPAFDLLEIQVDGNTVLDATLIEKTVYPFLGQNKSIDTVEEARKTLEAVYKDKGYPTVLVEIPEQDVVEGLVKLNVVEGTVERLKITGSRYYSLGKITEQVPALAAGKVPHMPTVQQQVADLGKESADRQITPIFRAGSTPGKTEVELRVKDELPLHGSLEMNGRNSESTTRSRLIASVRYDNLWQKFHSASLQYQVSPENYDEVEVWSGTYVLPTGWEDTRLALYGIGISSNTELGTSIGGMSVVGTGSIYGGRLIKPLASIIKASIKASPRKARTSKTRRSAIRRFKSVTTVIGAAKTP
jgi:hemolysin activation/secretion protein